jgi:hypothetical protein
VTARPAASVRPGSVPGSAEWPSRSPRDEHSNGPPPNNPPYPQSLDTTAGPGKRSCLHGRDLYLGRYGSRESKERYERTVSLWLMNHRQLPPVASVAGRTVGEVPDAFARHSERHYVHPNGTPTGEHENLLMAIGPLRALYASISAEGFDPQSLAVVRQRMVDLGWCRPMINRNVGRIRRWAVAQGFLGGEVYQRLKRSRRCDRGEPGAGPETGGASPPATH